MRHLSWAFSLIALGTILVASGLAQSPAGAPGDLARPKRTLTTDEAELVNKFSQQMSEHYNAGRFADAVAPGRRAFEIRSGVQGPAYWEPVSGKSNLDLMIKISSLPADAQREWLESIVLERDEMPKLRGQGRLRDVVPVAARVVAIRERHLGPESGFLARALNAHGISYNETGQYKLAEPVFRRAIAAAEKAFGAGHPGTISAKSNFAICLQGLGRYKEAQNLHEDILKMRTEIFGPDSPETAIAANNLALSLEYQAFYRAAETLHRQAK